MRGTGVAMLWSTGEMPVIRRVAEQVTRVDWIRIVRRVGRVFRRLPLLTVMAVPFLLGFGLRLAARGAARVVWAIGWLGAWLFYTAAEGWAAAAGSTGERR